MNVGRTAMIKLNISHEGDSMERSADAWRLDRRQALGGILFGLSGAVTGFGEDRMDRKKWNVAYRLSATKEAEYQRGVQFMGGCAAFAPNGQLFAHAYRDGRVHLRRTKNGSGHRLERNVAR